MAEKPTPASLFKSMKLDDDQTRRYRRDIEHARAEGIAEGRTDTRMEMLSWLEEKYYDKTLDRRSPEAKALLELTKELSLHFKKLYHR